MPKRTGKKAPKQVEALTHDEASRKNIPTAEYQSVMAKEVQSPLRVAYECRNRDLDPQLAWRGKDEQDWSDLVVPAPLLFIQEKVLRSPGTRETAGSSSYGPWATSAGRRCRSRVVTQFAA